MPVSDLRFQGINRTITDYASAGACEELINLRPTGTGLVPIKPFGVKMGSVPYGAVFVHKAGEDTNYIAVEKDALGIVRFFRVSDSGQKMGDDICYFDASGFTTFSYKDINFAYTGNIILISIADNDDDFYKNLSFLWDGETYKERQANVPELEFSFSTGQPFVVHYDGGENPGEDYLTSLKTQEIFKSAQNAIEEGSEDYCFGSFILAIAYKTKDGKTFWTNKLMYYNPLEELKNSELYIDPSSIPAELQQYFPEGAFIFVSQDVTHQDVHEFHGAGIKVSLVIGSIPYSSWDEESSMIQSVEVYASRPSFYVPYNPEMICPVLDSYHGFMSHVALAPKGIQDTELGNQLMYLQKSIPITELVGASADYVLDLKFGGNIQTTNKTLEVDAGATTRYGSVLSYNNRFHLYKSVAKKEIGMPDFYYKETPASTEDSDVFVVYNDGQKDHVVYCGTAELPDISTTIADAVIVPILNVKSVVVQQSPSGGTAGSITYSSLTNSERYNYSHTDKAVTSSYQTGLIYNPSTEKGYALIDEPTAINVSEQYNPFVFKVEHSYLAPGAILDVQPQMVAVRDVTYGDYPLNVFTNRGTYALLQGSGTVLYGAFRSISNLVTTSNSVSTEIGTFFVAAGAIWVVAGNNAVLVSDALALGPHKFIRSCPGYQSLSNAIYDIEGYESAVTFEEYLDGAVLSYNRFRDEIYVSNKSYDYSYVLSLKHRQWFKQGIVISQDVIGSDIATSMKASGLEGEAGLFDYEIMDEDNNRIVFNLTYDGVNYPINFEMNIYTNLTQRIWWIESDFMGALVGTPFVNHAYLTHRIVVSNPGTENETQHIFFIIHLHRHSVDSDLDLSLISGNIGTYHWNSEAQEYQEILHNDFVFNGALCDVLNLADEDESAGSVLVHFQTRPFSVGYQYVHVHRVLEMVRASLSASDKLIVALYGSDNLQNWTLLSFADRSNVTISQIRTPSAARSWRYYTICTGGLTPQDTDFGNTLFEYTPVVRRIG